MLIGNIILSCGLVYISSNNYPGGEAFKTLHSKYSYLGKIQ